jgi:CheY-like chemotaxis protein
VGYSVLRPLSLTALLVDDDDVHSRLCRDSLENIDMALRAYSENEAAIKAIDDISTLQLPLHILITDIERPNGPLGLSFIENVRSASYAKIVGGGLRLRYLPLIVISNAARLYREQISRIDGAIPVYEKPMWEERLVEVIVDALSAYRSKILGELQHLGVAVVFREGLYQVLPAYGAQKPELIETDRFVGLASALSSSYTALCL